jgi:ribosomal protein L25 (general stress protein Ctc)
LIKVRLKDEQNKFHDLESRRDVFSRSWNSDKSLKEMHLEILNLMMKESSKMIENLDFDTKFQKAEIKIKIKDMQINKLREQIMYRDELIEESRNIMEQADLKELADNRILHLDQIIYDHHGVFDSGRE